MKQLLLGFLQGKWLRHPLHPVLVHIPVALWPSALLFDVLSRAGLGGNTLVRLSFYAIALGLASTLLAVPTGLADWAGIKRQKPAWKLGLYHMAVNGVQRFCRPLTSELASRTFNRLPRSTLPASGSQLPRRSS